MVHKEVNMPKFEIDTDPSFGVLIYAPQENLTTRCRSGSEVDRWVAVLKNELDTVAEDAKKAIWKMRQAQDFPGERK